MNDKLEKLDPYDKLKKLDPNKLDLMGAVAAGLFLLLFVVFVFLSGWLAEIQRSRRYSQRHTTKWSAESKAGRVAH